MKLFGNVHRKGTSNHGDSAASEDRVLEQEFTGEVDVELDEAALEDLLSEDISGEDLENGETPETADPDAGEDLWDGGGEDDGDEDAGEDDSGDDDDAEKPKKKRKVTVKRVLIVGLSCLVVVLIGCGLFVNYLLGLINYQKANSDFFVKVSNVEDMEPEEAVTSRLEALDRQELDSTMEASPEDLARWDSALASVTSDNSLYTVPVDEDVYNILLVGSDARDLSEAARSDAMILVSLNQKSKTIYLTSFLRDCYVSIPGYGNTRLNHAFAYGGPQLLMDTLESNFKIHVDRYMAVNFYSFMDVIDILGGVWIYVTEEEADITNDYIWSMNKLLGEDWDSDYLWSYGWYKLNGKQALAYARNRYVGNDYERTARQRTVISQIYEGAMQASPAVLVDLAVAILPQIVTDMTKSEVLGYAANALAYMDYEMVSQQIPAPGTYSGATISGMSVISLDLDDNIEFLQSTVYGDVSYSSEQGEGDQEEEDAEEPTATPKASSSPAPSPSAKATASAKPKTVVTPQPSATAKPSATPKASATPKPTAEKDAAATASPNIAPPAVSNTR